MIKMKRKAIVFTVLLLIFCLLFTSCSYLSNAFYLWKYLSENPNEEEPSSDKMNEFQLTYKICESLFGTSPEVFCETNGKDTLLYNNYTDAKVTENGDLALYLTDSQVDAWKNSSFHLQMLQKILGEEKEIVTKIIPPIDFGFGSLYKDADTRCGFEISDDYSKIIASPNDDHIYECVVPDACVMMQLLSGKQSDEISVEYVAINSKGEVTKRLFFPIYMYMFQDIDECKELKTYEQIPSKILEYHDPEIDEAFENQKYKAFWGMKYQSANLNYEIMAYEFVDKDDSLQYYRKADDDKKATWDEDNAEWVMEFCENTYKIIVASENRVYKIISSNTANYKIDQMLSEVFSIKI